MNKTDQNMIADSRAAMLQAAKLMDDGKYRASAVECVRSSKLALDAVLVSWNLVFRDQSCLERLKVAGRESPVSVTSQIRHCCRKIDRHDTFYGELEGNSVEATFDEEGAMELINYGREIMRFAQRNLFRGESTDGESGGS